MSRPFFEKYEQPNKCPLKFVTKLVRNPGHSDCVERFSGCLLKVSNWRPCVHQRRVVTTAVHPKNGPLSSLVKMPTLLVVGRSLRTRQRGLNEETFFLNDVNYVNPGSIVLSRSPDIIQLVFVIIIIMNVNDFYPDVRNVPDKNNGVLIYILVFWDMVSRSYRSILYRLIRHKVTLVEYCEN